MLCLYFILTIATAVAHHRQTTISLILFPWLFPDQCQIPWLFQIFQMGGHPVYCPMSFLSPIHQCQRSRGSNRTTNKPASTQRVQTATENYGLLPSILTSFTVMPPRNIAATVRYLPCRGSHAAIMFLASNVCWTSSGTVRARYCWLPRDVSRAKARHEEVKLRELSHVDG